MEVVPTFCRHNRLIQNCPICAREQSIEARPVVSSSAPAISRERPSAPRPRGVGGADHGRRTFDAYRQWAARAGSQAAAFAGEPGWTPERRFARVLERMALPGLHRDARYELLVSLGRLGLYELRPGQLALGGENEVTVAAKRSLGIGDPLLLERRASA